MFPDGKGPPALSIRGTPRVSSMTGLEINSRLPHIPCTGSWAKPCEADRKEVRNVCIHASGSQGVKLEQASGMP